MNKISVRQLCLFMACLVPCGKLLAAPAALAGAAGGDLLISALINFVCQGVMIYLILWLSQKTERTFFELLCGAFGKVAAKIIYVFFAAYFLFYSVLPVLEQKAFVQSEFYDSFPSFLVFLPFFFFSLFACTKNVTAIGRGADIALPLFAVGFLGIFFMAASSADFSAVLPIGDSSFPEIISGSLRTQNWFADSAFLLMFLGRFPSGKKTTLKVMISYAVGAAATLAFIFVFYGIFKELSPREIFAVSKIGRYYSALSVIGRVDILFGYIFTVALLIYSVVPLQLFCECLSAAFGEKRILYSCIVNAALFIAVLLLNRSAFAVYETAGKLFPVFTIFAYALPCAALFMRCPHAAKKR